MKYINAIAHRTIAAVGGVLCCTLFTMSAFAELCGDGVGVMSIAGRWRFALGDTTNCTDVIDLPSTTDIARKGNGRINARELEKIDPMRDDAYLTDALTRHPTRRFPYVGPATYERDVDVPAEWAGKRIELMVERTKYVSVYFDGNRLGGARRWRRLPSWSCRAARRLDAIACASWWTTDYGGVLSLDTRFPTTRRQTGTV